MNMMAARPLKIVDVAEFYSERGGGVRTYIRQKLAAAAALGVDMTIVAPGPFTTTETPIEGGRIRWIASPREPFDPRYFRFNDAAAIHAVLDEEAPDVVEASSPWAGARVVARWRGKAFRALVMHMDPVAVYPHTALDGLVSADTVDRACGWFWHYLRQLSRRFDQTIVAGDWLAARLTRFRLQQPVAIPFGIEKQLFSPALRCPDTRRAMLAACGIDDSDTPLLIAVSRHHPEKRLSVLIRAVARLRRRRPVGLYIIGDGPARVAIGRMAARVPGVHLAGVVSDRQRLATLLASADAFVHGGAAETFGLAVGEALCAGLPLVTPDRGGAADIARPEFAETYRTGDSRACADAIARLLARPRAPLVDAACLAADRLWTPHQHFSALFEHYRRQAREPEALAAA